MQQIKYSVSVKLTRLFARTSTVNVIVLRDSSTCARRDGCNNRRKRSAMKLTRTTLDKKSMPCELDASKIAEKSRSEGIARERMIDPVVRRHGSSARLSDRRPSCSTYSMARVYLAHTRFPRGFLQRERNTSNNRGDGKSRSIQFRPDAKRFYLFYCAVAIKYGDELSTSENPHVGMKRAARSFRVSWGAHEIQ